MMRKITLLFTFLMVSFGFAQAPTTDPATPPAREASDVISIFSQAYSNVPNVNYNPNWGQSGFATANTAFPTGASDNVVLAYPNFNYQGIDFNGTIDISSMEYLHLDLWTVGGVEPNVYVISGGAEVANPVPADNDGFWRSIDIPVQNITLNLNGAFQFKFDGGNGSQAIYIDNLYFWKTPVDPATDASLSDLRVDGTTINGFGSGVLNYAVDLTSATPIPQVTATTTQAGASAVITQASGVPGSATVQVTSQDMSTTKTYTVNFAVVGPQSAAPTPPNRPAADVKSIFSDAYAPIATLNYAGVDGQPSNDNTFNTSWCPATTELVQIQGNNTNKVTGLGCEGIAFLSGRFDATDFTHFHMDIYTDTPTMDKSFNIKFSNWNNTGGEVNAIEFSTTNASNPALPSTNPGTWISLDIPLTSWTAGARNDLAQFIITSDLGTVYYDNLYLHKNTLGINEFDTASFNVFPNPSKDTWTIKTKDMEMSSIEVYDMVGKNVMSLTPNASETLIDGSHLNTGLYFARITTNGNVNTVKLIKN